MGSGVGRAREFMRRNIVMIVMVPVLVGLHYGWQKLQDVEMFVPKEQRRDLPIMQVSQSAMLTYPTLQLLLSYKGGGG